MSNTAQSIAIIGAGKLGITLAQLALKAEYSVSISGSGAPEKIALSVEVLAPGALAMSTQAAAASADVIILALPLGKFRTITPEMLAGKLVIDAMNYWWEVDGERDMIIPKGTSSSQVVQEYFSSSRVVKALNHVGYHDLHDHAKPKGDQERRAVALAGDIPSDIEVVSKLIDELGFDPLHIGTLSAGAALEPGQPAFGASVGSAELGRLIHP